MQNGFDNNIIVGIDIGSENIFCSIGKIEGENNNVKLLGLGIAPVLDSFKKGLKVMDTTAFTLSQENKLPIIINWGITANWTEKVKIYNFLFFFNYIIFK